MCRLAGIPRVLGHARERAYGLLSDEIPDRDEVGDGMRHEVRRQLDLVGAVGLRTRDERLRFRVLEGDREAVRQRLVAAGVGPRQPFVVVHPGASAPSRRYPADRLGESAGLLRQAMAASTGAGGPGDGPPAIVVCGGPGEESLVQETVRALAAADLPASTARGLVLSPRVSGVGELAALIAEADLLIGNNSGPVHLAAAVGTPVVDMYALTNPQHTPWLVPSRVLFRDVPCRFCQKSLCPEGHHRCLSGVSPREVAAAAIALMPARFTAIVPPPQPALGEAA
jgi:ADP-heptose:LPS heptosyltransferase